MAVGRIIDSLGSWIEASESMLLNPNSCNTKGAPPRLDSLQLVHRIVCAACVAQPVALWLKPGAASTPTCCTWHAHAHVLLSAAPCTQAHSRLNVSHASKHLGVLAPASADGLLTSPLLPEPGAAEYADCQLECLLNAECVAWMHGTDDDWDCTIDETCPNLVREPGWSEGVGGWAEAPPLGAKAGSHSEGPPPQ